MQLNLDYVNAKTVILPPYERLTVWVVGCGGTGSAVVPLVCRILNEVQQSGKQVEFILVDPDTVEERNTRRQCFTKAEIGFNKAQLLAARYSLTWNSLTIHAISDFFHPRMVEWGYRKLNIIVGCVDDSFTGEQHGRRAIATALSMEPAFNAGIWWLDCGNSEKSGQVVIGSKFDLNVKQYFSQVGCIALPVPSMQDPDLIKDSPPKPNVPCGFSPDTQHILVNPQTALIAAGMLSDLLSGKLKRYATYFDSAAGSMRSDYIIPEAIEQIIEKEKERRPNERLPK